MSVQNNPSTTHARARVPCGKHNLDHLLTHVFGDVQEGEDVHSPAATTTRPRGLQVLPVYPSSLVTATNMVLDDDVTECGLVLADADRGPQSFEQQEQTMLIALTLGAQNTPPNAQQQHLSATTTIDLSDAAQSNVEIVSGLGHQVNMVLSCPGCTAPRCVGARSPVGREVGGEGVFGNPQGSIMGPSQRCITGVCHGGLSQGSRMADL